MQTCFDFAPSAVGTSGSLSAPPVVRRDDSQGPLSRGAAGGVREEDRDESGLSRYTADLHVHVGRNGRGQAVKITASRRLTLPALVRHAWQKTGIDIIGVIDCACTGVLQDLRGMIERGELMELPEGGLRHLERVTLIPGAEVEAVESHGGVSHHLCYFPYLRNLAEFSKIMSRYITNMELSSQRCGLPARELAAVVEGTGGVLIPAHAFTPHKSVYGNAADRLEDLLGDHLAEVPAIELGLSADSNMADHLSELAPLTFLSNSDAHSLEKIAREYNVLRLAQPNFRELMLALRREAGRRVELNVGMNPQLGRYHRSYCLKCEAAPPTQEGAVLACPTCGSIRGKDFVLGVWDRILQVADRPETCHPEHRPEYLYQVPLRNLPGLGPRVYQQLLEAFGTEMAVLHQAPRDQLARLVGPSLSSLILAARSGQTRFTSGAGGSYGKCLGVVSSQAQLELFA